MFNCKQRHERWKGEAKIEGRRERKRLIDDRDSEDRPTVYRSPRQICDQCGWWRLKGGRPRGTKIVLMPWHLWDKNSKYRQMYSSKQTWWKEVERDLIDDPCSWIRPKPVPKSHVCALHTVQLLPHSLLLQRLTLQKGKHCQRHNVPRNWLRDLD